jgi:hypothetical protein
MKTIRTAKGRTMIDLTGDRFHSLTVLGRSEKTRPGHTYWRCQCDCGRIVDLASHWLRAGTIHSCGCSKGALITAKKTVHGQSGNKTDTPETPEYRVWTHIQSRCYNQNVRDFHNYGGRGIVVCDRWRGDNGFVNFFADMGCRPSPKHSIDRFPDNDGPYSPENCRWATHTEQQRNTRKYKAAALRRLSQSQSPPQHAP